MHQSQHHRLPVAALCAALALATAGVASADQSAPAPNPPADAPHGANRQQWDLCRKQADDQKLARGEARREFMRNCMKGSQPGAAQTSS
jgi:hypothetical protein